MYIDTALYKLIESLLEFEKAPEVNNKVDFECNIKYHAAQLYKITVERIK